MKTRRIRIRWRKTAAMVIVGYLVFWSGDSLFHMWQLSQQEASYRQRIQETKRNSQILHHDIQKLHNPKIIKAIISGQQNIPKAP